MGQGVRCSHVACVCTDMTDLYQWTTLLLPVLLAIVAWFLGRRQRTNDNLEMLQSTIDKLLAGNTGLYSQIMKLRQDNAILSNDIKAHKKIASRPL